MLYIWKVETIRNRRGRIRSTLLLLVLTLFLFLYNWVAETIPQAHILPKVEQIDISIVLEQEEYTEVELQSLSIQTGLHPKSVQRLLEQGRDKELLQIQKQYFAPVEIESLQTTPLTVSELLVDDEGCRISGMPLADLQNGDILLTKNSRFLGWRNGHAALVVDAEQGLLLEAIMLGLDTRIGKVSKWSCYPSFLVLRLKSEYGDIPQQVAEYASEHLTDVPYHLLAGVTGRLFPSRENREYEEGIAVENIDSIKGTHCAHLVWYAYMQFGIDLDSDGGVIVTPYDIQKSEYLDIIQTFGY